MAIKMISLPEYLNLRLMTEQNASGLIQSLLRKHYEMVEPEKAQDNLTKEIAELEKKKDELIVKVEEKQKEEALELEKIADEKAEMERKEKEYENSEERWQGILKTQLEVFEKLYDVSNHERTARFNEFFMELKKGEVKNLAEFCEKRGIKKKKSRNGDFPKENGET